MRFNDGALPDVDGTVEILRKQDLDGGYSKKEEHNNQKGVDADEVLEETTRIRDGLGDEEETLIPSSTKGGGTVTAEPMVIMCTALRNVSS